MQSTPLISAPLARQGDFPGARQLERLPQAEQYNQIMSFSPLIFFFFFSYGIFVSVWTTPELHMTSTNKTEVWRVGALSLISLIVFSFLKFKVTHIHLGLPGQAEQGAESQSLLDHFYDIHSLSLAFQQPEAFFHLGSYLILMPLLLEDALGLKDIRPEQGWVLLLGGVPLLKVGEAV